MVAVLSISIAPADDIVIDKEIAARLLKKCIIISK
jgi:hypothetical protein